jgi:hypothetical protein
VRSDPPIEVRLDPDAPPGDVIPVLADLLLSLAERRPDYLSFEDLLALDLTEAEARAVLAGQPQVHRDEIENRLTLHRQQEERAAPAGPDGAAAQPDRGPGA